MRAPFGFRRTVGALSGALITMTLSQQSGNVQTVKVVSDFVCRQTLRMPKHLRWGMLAATLAFELWSVVRTGRTADRLPPSRVRRLIDTWRQSRVGLLRDFVRYYETLVAFSAISARQT